MSLMPAEDIVYLGDTARVPYGVRSPDTVRRYASEGADYLRMKGVKLLVVACNTVSAVGLEEVAKHCDVPVIGVIEPGARAAAAASSTGHVGVIGTEATIASQAYVRAIRSFDASVTVHGAACPLFVPLAEEGWTEGDVPGLVARHYLSGFENRKMDVLVLGCTHYPLLEGVIAGVIGNDITIIDSASETAREVRDVLEREGLTRTESGSRQGVASFFVTDSPGKFLEVGQRFLQREITDINKIELSEVF